MRLSRFARTSLAGLVVAMLLGILGCGKEAKTEIGKAVTTDLPKKGELEVKDKSGTAGDKEASLATAKPDFVLTADEFFTEWSKDKAVAEKKYTGKVIELGGKIDTMGLAGGQTPMLSLKASKDAKESKYVRCQLAEKNPWAKVAPGQQIKLRGKLSEYSLSDPMLEKCALIELGPNPAIVISPSDLAKEYAADTEKTTKKYQDKPLIVEGEVEDKKVNEAGAATVFLKGSDGMRVQCVFTAFNQNASEAIKKGSRLKVVGNFLDLVSNKEGPGLHDCLIISLGK